MSLLVHLRINEGQPSTTVETTLHLFQPTLMFSNKNIKVFDFDRTLDHLSFPCHMDTKIFQK